MAERASQIFNHIRVVRFLGTKGFELLKIGPDEVGGMLFEKKFDFARIEKGAIAVWTTFDSDLGNGVSFNNAKGGRATRARKPRVRAKVTEVDLLEVDFYASAAIGTDVRVGVQGSVTAGALHSRNYRKLRDKHRQEFRLDFTIGSSSRRKMN